MMKTVVSLAFAAACVALAPSANAQIASNELVTNGPQASRGDFGDWNARRNVIESRHYDRLLQISPGFRHARMRRECGPISDPQLRSNCLASFDRYEPMVRSTLAPRRYRTLPSAGY